jgi:hypothetical protein
MTLDEFVNRLNKPLYVYKMARAKHNPRGDVPTPMSRAAQTNMENSAKELDEIVLARARTIMLERSASNA